MCPRAERAKVHPALEVTGTTKKVPEYHLDSSNMNLAGVVTDQKGKTTVPEYHLQ